MRSTLPLNIESLNPAGAEKTTVTCKVACVKESHSSNIYIYIYIHNNNRDNNENE